MNLNISTIVDEWQNAEFTQILDFLSTKEILRYVDLGANIGISCEFVTKAIESIDDIWLFEPDGDNFKLLLDRIKELKPNNYHFINKAVYFSDKNEIEACGVGDKNAGGYFLETVIEQNVKNENIEKYNKKFKITKLETELGTKQIDLIKIDIEGSEYNIIENSMLIPTINYILVEFHWRKPDEIKQFVERTLLKSHNIVFNFSNYHHILFVKKGI